MVLAAIIDAAGMTTALPECHATALSEHGEQLLEEETCATAKRDPAAQRRAYGVDNRG